jgi:hypothetical protein
VGAESDDVGLLAGSGAKTGPQGGACTAQHIYLVVAAVSCVVGAQSDDVGLLHQVGTSSASWTCMW